MHIVQIALDQCGDISSRLLAVLDKIKDLYLVYVRYSNKYFLKLGINVFFSKSFLLLKHVNVTGRKIESFQWNAKDNIIAAIQDTQLIVWYCPTAAFNSKLLKLCSLQYDSPELGRSPRIQDFVGNSVAIRRADGSLLTIPISPFPSILHK